MNCASSSFAEVSQSENTAVNCGAPVIHFEVIRYFLGNGLSPFSTQICQSTSLPRNARW